jgi:hypothetical protein
LRPSRRLEKTGSRHENKNVTSPMRIGPVLRSGALCFFGKKPAFAEWNFRAFPGLSVRIGGPEMLVERGLRVMNVEVVGDAYAIASNYLRRSGGIPDSFATNERLLQIIVELFQRGEFNRIKLANKAISRFEADELV